MSKRKSIVGVKNQAIGELALARDEARVRLHLLSLEARERWDELEAAIFELEQRASQEGEKASEVLGEKVRDLRQRLGELLTSQLSGSAGLLTNVRSLMSAHVRSCAPDQSLNDAAHVMWQQDCGVVPVVDQGRVVGMLTDRDICMATYTQGKSPSEIGVTQAMSHQVYGCSPDDSVGAALSIMAERRLHRLPVLSPDGQLLGVLALADVARFASAAGSAHVDAALAETLGAISKPQLPLAHAAE